MRYSRSRTATIASSIFWLLCACKVPLEQFTRPDGASDGASEDGLGCTRPNIVCGESCVNLDESSTNCGRCGRECGGGGCIAGACQPVVIAGGLLDQPARLAVNATTVYWTEPTRVRSCPLPAGCTGAPTVIADGYALLDTLAATDDAVYFSGCPGCTDHHEMTRCPATGCPAPTPGVISSTSNYRDIVLTATQAYWREEPDAFGGCLHSDCMATVFRTAFSPFGLGLAGIAVDGDTLYLKPGGTSVGSELRTCSNPSSCIITNSYAITPPFQIRNGKAYWVTSDVNSTIVLTCPLANCNSTSTFAVSEPGGAELAVDAGGVYWLSAAGALRSCPLAGCPATGPTTLAGDRINARQLTLGPDFAYWLEDNSIVKLARF
jgi:hypothetical protein